MKHIKSIIISAYVYVRMMPLLVAAKCPRDFRAENVDAMVVFTERARDHVAQSVCGQAKADAYIKRYIDQRVEETNYALRKGCVPFKIRIVKTFGPWKSEDFDETTLIRKGVGDKFGYDFTPNNPVTNDDMAKYGADIKILIYHHSKELAGGGASGDKIIVPLQMRMEKCFGNTPVDTKDWYVFAHEFGHYMGANDWLESKGGCSKIHHHWRTIMSDPPNTGSDFCKPRRLKYSKACAEKMINQPTCDQHDEDYDGAHITGYECKRKEAQVGDCETIVRQSNIDWLGNGACDFQVTTVQSLDGYALNIDLNSAMCDYDNGDCCKKTCSGDFCGQSDFECLDPSVLKNDICKPVQG